MTNSGNIFADELVECLLEAGFIQSRFQMSIYYKYAPYGKKIVFLYYVDYCFYFYNSEALGKWFVDTLGKIFHVNFLGYANWFMSKRISQMKDHSISVDQAIYATYIVVKYLDNSTGEARTKSYNNTFPSDMIFIKADASTSDEQVERLTRE